MTDAIVHTGDCLDVMRTMSAGSIDLIYLDPPFFTQKTQRQSSRRGRVFSFDDLWRSQASYAEFLYHRLAEMHRLLTPRGAIVFHCDTHANHIARLLLDDIFGDRNFRAEIIWHYRRWSNTRKGLLPAHQTLYWYSRGDDYTFNPHYGDYSPATNVDQILQLRARDARNKAVYKRDEAGQIAFDGAKKGVPLGDVWDLPYLNPKASERVGYPTQKPILLLERIIALFSDPGDRVLDPFCGSGTTLVAAEAAGRHAIGIDTSAEATQLTRGRLAAPVRTSSRLIEKGRDAYDTADRELLGLLGGLDLVPVHRNRGIDAFLRDGLDGAPVPIRVQRPGESLADAAAALHRAAQSKGVTVALLVRTTTGDETPAPAGVVVIDSAACAVNAALDAIVQRRARRAG